MSKSSLTSRPLDLIYFCFFLTHIPASLLLDFQTLYPPSYVPTVLLDLQQWYISFSADPLIGGIARGEGNNVLGWFACFTWIELLFQFPVFFLGMRGLWNGSRSIYVLILAYGASTATTTLPCILYILQQSSKMTSAQQAMLLSSYIPFFLLPLMMAVDMGFRIHAILGSAEVKRKAE